MSSDAQKSGAATPTPTRAFKPLSLASSAAALPTSPSPALSPSASSPGPKRQLRAGRMSSISYSSPRSFTHDVARGKENAEPGVVKARPLTLVEKHADLLSSIAQKEAKVNEARQELKRHEAELAELRRRWEHIATRPNQRINSSSISSLPSNASSSSSSIASSSTPPTSIESSSPDIGAVAQLSAMVQNALGPDQPIISPAAVDTGKRLLGQLMRSVGGGEHEPRGSLEVVTEEGQVISHRAEPRMRRLSLVPEPTPSRVDPAARRKPATSPTISEDPALWASRAADDGWTKRWDDVLGSDGFQSSKRATINFGSTLSDSLRSVLPVDLFPLPNLSPTPNTQSGHVPSTPTPRPKPIRLREISSSRSVMDDDGEGDGLGIGFLPKPISPARPRPTVSPKIVAATEEEDSSWEW